MPHLLVEADFRERSDWHFAGDLEILGDLCDRSTVTVDGTLVVHGRVDGARVKAGESVMVHGGVVRSTLEAGEDLVLGFAENCVLKCAGRLYARENLIQCDADARGAVVAGGHVVGGVVISRERVEARVLGSARGTPTRLIVLPDATRRPIGECLAGERQAVQHQIQQLVPRVRHAQRLAAAVGAGAHERLALRRRLEELARLSASQAELAERLRAVVKVDGALTRRVKALEAIHAEVVLEVGKNRLHVTETYWADDPRLAYKLQRLSLLASC